VIPIADDNRFRRRTPWVTYLLLAANIAIFVWAVTADPAEQVRVYAEYAAVPAHVLTPDPAAWLPLVTCTFLHASWAHLAGNMLFLWIFGDNVEDAMGHGRYLVFYLLCGVAASLVQVLLNAGSQVPLVGASGAIAGVLAAYVRLFPRGGVRTLVVLVPPFFVWPTLPAWLLIGVWFVTQFWSGLMSLGSLGSGGVAYGAHVGGFVVGLLLARRFARRGGVEHRLTATSQHGVVREPPPGYRW